MESNFISDIIQMLIILFVITCAMFALIYLLKRYRFKALLSFQKTPQINLISMRHLGPKKSIAIVEIAEQWLVLGLGGESVNLLTKMDKPLVEETPDDDHTLEAGRESPPVKKNSG